MTDWHAIAQEYWSQQPHPHAPTLTNGEFPTAMRLATQAKFGGHASPQEAEAFWREFQGMNGKLAASKQEPITPEEFGHLLDKLAPLSFVYHGRPPQLNEVAALRDAHPTKQREYFSELPDKHYPDVPAGAMVKSMKAAGPAAQRYLQREPVKLEAAYLHHSGQSPETYYQGLKQEQDQAMQGQQQQQPAGGQGGVQAPAG
jgi:hypothetical protein